MIMIAPVVLGALIAAGLGLLKSEAIDRPKEQRDRKLRAAQIRFSPFKEVPLQQISSADPIGTAVNFGAAGAQLGGNIQAADSQSAFNDALLKQMGTGGGLSTEDLIKLRASQNVSSAAQPGRSPFLRS